MTPGLQLASLVYAAVLARWLSIRDRRVLFGVLAAALVLAWVPYPWGPVAWLASYTGEFSLTTVVLAGAGLAHRAGIAAAPGRRELRGICLVIVAAAAIFYPLSLGAAPLNPYEWGFGSYAFSSALLGLGLMAWLLRAWFVLAIVVLAQFGLALELLASDNLWDHLLDVWLVFWAAGWLVRDAWLHRPGLQTSE
jgi:hypothetical protein